MDNITMLYPKGKTRVLTFSYDDGVKQDIRLVDIFNKYGLKCTFNINSKRLNEPTTNNYNGTTIESLDSSIMADLYKGHEIATHSYSHPFFSKLPESSISDEIRVDRVELEKLSGYIVRGHAYPFGEYDKRTIRQLENNFIAYARTTVSTENFQFPQNFLEWHPTCHHNSPKLMELLERFLNPRSYGSLFYVWGHSYEFDVNDDWNVIEEFCEKASGKDDVWYATNIEIYDYIQSFYLLNFSSDRSMVYNPTSQEIYFKINDETRSIKSGETISLNK